MSSSALYLVAVRMGDLSVVGLLASMYPISTVILARLVLKESIKNVQWIGVICALACVTLLALP
jgi:drug/metabolite transporter (DMT)-like permease